MNGLTCQPKSILPKNSETQPTTKRLNDITNEINRSVAKQGWRDTKDKKISKPEDIGVVGLSVDEVILPIRGYSGYFVSNLGRILTNRGKVLFVYKQDGKSVRVQLPLNGSRPYHIVSELIAANFLVREKDHDALRYIDSDRTNSNLNNLEWVNSLDYANTLPKIGSDEIFVII